MVNGLRMIKYVSRAPRGARGLKSGIASLSGHVIASRPARGAWIEIPTPKEPEQKNRSRPARGAWIEMPSKTTRCWTTSSRAPRGARGLKWRTAAKSKKINSRAPRGARGLKWPYKSGVAGAKRSRPARGAWIEIPVTVKKELFQKVAPREGRVD